MPGCRRWLPEGNPEEMRVDDLPVHVEVIQDLEGHPVVLLDLMGAVVVTWEWRYTWWRHDMERISPLLSFREDGSHHRWFPLTKGVMQSFGVIFAVTMNRLLNKQVFCSWCEAPWRFIHVISIIYRWLVAQDCDVSNSLAMETLQSCAMPSIRKF